MQEKKISKPTKKRGPRLQLELPEAFRKQLEEEASVRGVQPAELAKVWLYEALRLKTNKKEN